MEKIVWQNDVFNGVTIAKLFDGPNSKEIRINLEKGAQMKEHKAPGAIMVQVLSGKVDFSVGENSFILDALDMITLEPNVIHALTALENSIVRLSLSKNDDVSRVFGVLRP
ncbi:cupin domain-containing protein [Campylobacter sp. Marseille-Q3452]|uniref:Cupin domain-containing protein n=1 Tax=Campylobacter massiliensis TaxID=2762557 RepID=A0A842J8Z4_9BACT|nr:cupin domain-containing protein [Campylobacter massiliensis]MBC2883025.1 cupin domain-containing protein [Campylobacter massiliensis]